MDSDGSSSVLFMVCSAGISESNLLCLDILTNHIPGTEWDGKFPDVEKKTWQWCHNGWNVTGRLNFHTDGQVFIPVLFVNVTTRLNYITNNL